jgi:peptidoglycan/xylan/chitin deacetylase (PgdA/CDA1 family)
MSVAGCAAALVLTGGRATASTNTAPPETTVPPASAPATTVPQRDAWREVKVVYRVETDDPVVFITIDDGAVTSDQLGDWLDRRTLPIVNFVMPGILEQRADWFQNHSYSHAHMTKSTLQRQTFEICRASRIIGELTGTRPTMFRPPRGSWNDDTRRAAHACGIRHIVMWNVTADRSTIRTATGRPVRAGDIVILHWRPDTQASLEHLLAYLRTVGLRPALLDDYLT